jgi:phosphoribosylamine--glycine ligase
MGTSLLDNQFINTGGRVLCVTHLADTLEKAREEVYQEIRKIEAKQCFYRKDIGLNYK